MEITTNRDPVHNITSVMNGIKAAATAAIPKSDGYYKVCPVPWWSNECKDIRKEHNKACKHVAKYPTVSNCMQYKKLRGLSQRIQKTSRVSSWKSFVSTVNSYTECSKIWRKVDKIKGKHCPKPTPIIKINDEVITNAEEVANVFAEKFANVAVKTKNLNPAEYSRAQVKRRRYNFSRSGGHPDNIYVNAPFTMEDLEEQLSQCKDTSPGPDEITAPMLKHLSIETKVKLLTSLNQLWEAGKYPGEWQKEVKLPFLKPGKDPNLPESYRPISLTSCICKLFERMINQRLMWFLEKNNFLCPQQSGFRKNKSTMDSLAQLTSYIEKGFHNKKHTVAVFFDLEKAYDTVWRAEILNSLYEMGLRGNLPKFIENFLTDCQFCVRIGACHSEYVKQEEGLPQGSVLSVTCFAITINDIVKQLSTEVQCTVNDFAIFISARNVIHSSRPPGINQLTHGSDKGERYEIFAGNYSGSEI